MVKIQLRTAVVRGAIGLLLFISTVFATVLFGSQNALSYADEFLNPRGSVGQVELSMKHHETSVQAQAVPASITLRTTLTGSNVAPKPVKTRATGSVTTTYTGKKLVVQATFSGLSSPLRDYEKNRFYPGIHLHIAPVGQTNKTPFYRFAVELNEDGLSGTFGGTVTLTDEQVEALLNQSVYVDIHTSRFPDGEVRGQMVRS